jgi:hypothetical protein
MASPCWRANDSPEKVIKSFFMPAMIPAPMLRAALPECEAVVVGDVSTLAEMRSVAAQVSELGPMNAVIHNVRALATMTEIALRPRTACPASSLARADSPAPIRNRAWDTAISECDQMSAGSNRAGGARQVEFKL